VRCGERICLAGNGSERCSTGCWMPRAADTPELDPDGRTVTVAVTHRVPVGNQQAFVEAMQAVRGSRLRTGTISWGRRRPP
jgi:hypothetical protein